MLPCRKLTIIFSLVLFSCAIVAFAAAPVTVNVNIPGVPATLDATKGPCQIVFGFYNFAMALGGILALGAITYGGVKYTFAAGNPAGQSEGKAWVRDALLGLLLLAGAYLILNIINPDITKCGLTALDRVDVAANTTTVTCAVTTSDVSLGNMCTNRPVADCSACTVAQQCGGQAGCTAVCGACSAPTENCTPTTPPLGTCNAAAGACVNSPQLNAAISCINIGAGRALSGRIGYTTNGEHHCVLSPPSISCHFGGTSCRDGGHAFDISSKPSSMTWAQAMAEAQKCGTSCFYERADSSRVGSLDPFINHIHCNVGSCGCN